MSTPLISIVMPCYNEQEVLRETHRRVSEFASRLQGVRTEIIYVDDGSKDGTGDIIRALARQDDKVRGVIFSRNFGQQRAITAGIANASGDAVVLLDADLQDPPELIKDMIARWREGYDVVYATRTKREGESLFKLATASMFYRVLNGISEIPIPLDTGDFRLMDRKVVNAFLSMPEQDRYLRGMVSWVGFRQVALPYERAKRFAGETKYPFYKLMKVAFDGILSFSMSPLRVATYMGMFFAACATGIGGWLLFDHGSFTGASHGWLVASAVGLLVASVQLISIGMLGEYVGRIYSQSKGRPLYLISERLGFPERRAD